MKIHPEPAAIVELTPLWTGPRFASGRPQVPREVLDRLQQATTEQAWDVLRAEGYPRQFAGGWFQTHPGTVLVGRAVTAQFLPHRPDLDQVVVDAGAREGHPSGDRQNSWIIDGLTEDDVMVTDIFGKIENGTVIGDNLGTAIASRTGRGAVIDGGIRDLAGLSQLDGVNFFCRGPHPSAIRDVTLGGINLPVRVGPVTVLPGDVVLGTETGVTFIPAQLAEKVADVTEEIAVRDTFGKSRLAARIYGSADIDTSPWASAIEEDFKQWRIGRS